MFVGFRSTECVKCCVPFLQIETSRQIGHQIYQYEWNQSNQYNCHGVYCKQYWYLPQYDWYVRPAKCTSWEVSVLRHQAPTLLLYAVQNGKEKNRKSIKTKQLKPIKCHRKWFDVSIVERGNKWGASKLQFHRLHRKICHVHVIWSYFFDLCNYFSV